MRGVLQVIYKLTSINELPLFNSKIRIVKTKIEISGVIA